METCTVIEFTRSAPPYRIGEQAGFHIDTASKYCSGGFAKVITAIAPRVDPSVMATDARRRLDEISAMLAKATRDARDASKDPEAAESASEALRMAGEANAQIAALMKQLEANPGIADGSNSRRPSAAGKAA